tara:strand:+ start:23623 stop:24576 length:954 start_codon:yes stop_codon:yes gene_type:complete
LIKDHPDQSPPIIGGLLRIGETMNVIAAPKIGKSWLVHGLARSVALGIPWLGFEVRQGRVLIVDAELHQSELACRLRSVVSEGGDGEDIAVDILSLRGQMMDIYGLASLFMEIEAGQYSLVVLDALYRFLPRGCSENDNASMMSLYNAIDKIAHRLGAAVVVVHHSSKGSQSDKAITDVGSGAGSIARATDTHVAIRPHEQDGLAVLQAVCRSFQQPEPMTIKWTYPSWERVDVKPQLATRKTNSDERQRRMDTQADDAIRSAFSGRPLSIAQLRRQTGFGQARVERALARLNATGKRARNKRTGKTTERFTLPDSS